jgi:2-polyprenyl-6-hydroxyphenyl methylase/3-demethylubiquinone-9 3-methyltransferase
MWRAIECAAERLRPGGYLAIAIYAKTRFCGFWRAEKRIYSRSPKIVQTAIRGLYKTAYAARLAMKGKHPFSHMRNRETSRGMDRSHDIHDWLGGYPYESAHPSDVSAFLEARRFSILRAPACVTRSGVLGSGCFEIVARRL